MTCRSSTTQRQQTKWVVYGASMGSGGYLVLNTIPLFFPSLFLTGSLVSLIELAAGSCLALLIPFSIGLAILRSRLWDEVDLDQLRDHLMAVVQETMQPAHISLCLRNPQPAREHHTRLLPAIDEEEIHVP